jgi:hypothetical protein
MKHSTQDQDAIESSEVKQEQVEQKPPSKSNVFGAVVLGLGAVLAVLVILLLIGAVLPPDSQDNPSRAVVGIGIYDYEEVVQRDGVTEVRFRGRVRPGGQDNCGNGGDCTMMVGGVEVVWAQEEKFGPVGEISHVQTGEEVEVYGELVSDGVVTLYGSESFYIEPVYDEMLSVKQCEARGGVVSGTDGFTQEIPDNAIAQIADMAILAWCVTPCAADDACCLQSLETGTSKDNYLLYGRKQESCIEGYKKNQFKCLTSLAWCEPTEVRGLDGVSNGSLMDGVSLLHETWSEWGPCPGPEGSCWERALLYSDGRYEVVGYQGTTTYDLGDGLVRDYEALVEKLELRVKNCDGEPPVPDYYRTDLLYGRTEKIAYPGCVVEMELIDSLIKSFQVHSTVDPAQTNPTREWVDISMTEACTKEPWAPTRSQGGEGNIKTYFEKAGIHVYDVRITSRGPVCEACDCPPPEIKEILIDSSDKDEAQSLLSSVVL